jgi:hypothetical protein
VGKENGQQGPGVTLSPAEEEKLSARLVEIYARMEEIDAYGECRPLQCFLASITCPQ